MPQSSDSRYCCCCCISVLRFRENSCGCDANDGYLLGLHCSGPQKVADASEHCLLFLGFPALRLALPNLTGLFAGAALLRTSKGLLTPPCTASYFGLPSSQTGPSKFHWPIFWGCTAQDLKRLLTPQCTASYFGLPSSQASPSKFHWPICWGCTAQDLKRFADAQCAASCS